MSGMLLLQLLVIQVTYIQAALQGIWTVPAQCNDTQCYVEVSWRINRDSACFNLRLKTSLESWVALGFGKEIQQMNGSDVVYGYLDDHIFHGRIENDVHTLVLHEEQGLVNQSIIYYYDRIGLEFCLAPDSNISTHAIFHDCHYLWAMAGNKPRKPIQARINLQANKIYCDTQKLCLGFSDQAVKPTFSTKKTGIKRFGENDTTLEPTGSTKTTEFKGFVSPSVTSIPGSSEFSTLFQTNSSSIRPTASTKEYSRQCYLTSRVISNSPNFDLEDIDMTLCDVIIIAFVDVTTDFELIVRDPEDSNFYQALNNLTRDSGVKTIIDIGGWELPAERFSRMLQTTESRKVAIDSMMQYLDRFNVGGVQLDFQYPGSRESALEDKQRFTLLAKELRAAFTQDAARKSQESRLLGIGIPPWKHLLRGGYEFDELIEIVDFIILHCYDFHSSYEGFTGVHSALYPSSKSPNDDRNIDAIVTFLIEDLHVPSRKIILAITSQARGFTLADPNQFGIGAPEPSPNVGFTATPTTLAYYDVCELLKKNGSAKVWLDDQKVPYCHLNTTWISYDDQDSATAKAKYLKDKNLGGFALWTLERDDSGGVICNQGRYPILTAVNTELLGEVVHVTERSTENATLSTKAKEDESKNQG